MIELITITKPIILGAETWHIEVDGTILALIFIFIAIALLERFLRK